VLNAVSHRMQNIGPLVEGCSITGGIDGFVAVFHMAILIGWLDFSGGGFFARTGILPGGGCSRFLKIVLCSGNYVCCLTIYICL
jgi:hypothetical protein